MAKNSNITVPSVPSAADSTSSFDPYTDPSTGEVFAGPVPSAGAGKSAQPIGVAKGFTKTVQQQVPASYGYEHGLWDPSDVASGLVTQVPRTFGAQYFRGDEWTLAPDNPADVRALQIQLQQTGLLTSRGTTVLGQWDPQSATAFAKLLASANNAGAEWKDVLAARMAAVASGGLLGTQTSRAPLVVHLANPDDIRSTLQKTAQTLYGGNLPEQDVQAFIAAFQGQQAAASQAAYAAGENPNIGTMDIDPTTGKPLGGGGTVTNAPSTGAASEQFIRGQHPQEVAQQGFVNAMGDVLNTFTQGHPLGGQH